MSGTWLIFEGPDGAGKTTLARRAVAILTESGPTVSQHLTSKSDFEEYYFPPCLWHSAGLSVVQDRCALSDLTYAPVLSGVASRFGEGAVRAQLKLLAWKAVVIHVTAAEEDLATRLRVRGDDLITEPMLHAILKNYWREVGWWREAGATVMEFDTSGDKFPTDLELEMTIAVGHEELRLARGG